MITNKYTLGLDIGIASVGFGVIDDDFNIIDTGVRLFESGNSAKNVERREFRQGRRIKRRHTHRILRVEQFLETYGMNKDYTYSENILSLKLKGLTDKLELYELYAILANYVRARGISYLDDIAMDDAKNNSNYKESLTENAKKLETMHPCQIQQERLSKFNKYRGEVVDEDFILGNIFTTSSYKKEIQAILDNSAKYYDFIDDEFITGYLNIFESKRKYYIGSGNEKNRTDYGVYRTNGNTLDNIFSILIGYCSIYDGSTCEPELKSSKCSYTSQYFNFLTDMNNLTIDNRKITPSEKQEIKNLIIDNPKNSDIEVLKIICKVCNVDSNKIKGYRIDKNEKSIFHKFENYKKIKKTMENESFSIDKFTNTQLDAIFDALTINTDKESINEKLKSFGYVKEIIDFFECVKRFL